MDLHLPHFDLDEAGDKNHRRGSSCFLPKSCSCQGCRAVLRSLEYDSNISAIMECIAYIHMHVES